MIPKNTIILKNWVLLLVVALGFAACEKDENKIYLSSLTSDGPLIATETEVTLSKDKNSDIVLSLAWTKQALQISDPSLTAIDVTIQTLQASLTEDFSTTIGEENVTSLSKAYTGTELNALANNVGATVDQANDVYFRIAAQLGSNMTPVYSNVVKVAVTPYFMDMSTIYVLNVTDGTRTGVWLYSADSDGEYTGFMGVTSWYNFRLEEGDGTVWGNLDVSDTEFQMSSTSTWSLWFPSPGGCYYVDVNTNTERWSALYISGLTLTGGINGEMTASQSEAKWTYQFTADQAGMYTFQVAGTGKQYDYTTRTDDSKATSANVAFAQNGETLTFGDEAGDITVNVETAGTNTLTLDLTDPTAWKATVTAGDSSSSEEEGGDDESGEDEGGDDEGTGESKDITLTTYWVDSSSGDYYNGVAYLNSTDKFRVVAGSYTYGLGSATDEYSGSLSQGSDTYISAPSTSGLYYLNVQVSALSYSLVALGEQIYYSGLNNDWTSFVGLDATETAGVFQGDLTFTTTDGIKLYLTNAWTYEYGGYGGTLYYKGNTGITVDTTGTYTLTVNLIAGTYTIESKN